MNRPQRPTRIETGAGRQGALHLRLRDVDPARATVRLRERNDTEREQSASRSLVAMGAAHARRRGAGADDAVFRNRNGEPITGRRYDRPFARARVCLGLGGPHPGVGPRAASHRHHPDRIAGYPVAQAFAATRWLSASR